MTRKDGQPYWLLRADGAHHGFATVELDDAITSERAIEVWREREDPGMVALFNGIEITASLVTLSFVDGQPVVKEVK